MKTFDYKKMSDDGFRLGRAIAVGFLLLGFIGATIYVLLSSIAG